MSPDSILCPLAARRGRRACIQWPFVLEVVNYKCNVPSCLCSPTSHKASSVRKEQHLLEGEERDAASSSQDKSKRACGQIKACHSTLKFPVVHGLYVCVVVAILLYFTVVN